MPPNIEKKSSNFKTSNEVIANYTASTSAHISKNHKMASMGTMEPFDINHPKNWQTYYARFELFLVADDMQAERQTAVFLTLAGAPLYDLLSSLASPKKSTHKPTCYNRSFTCHRQLKSYFDKIHPHELAGYAENLPVKETFKKEDPVWIRNYASGQKWIPANIESQTGPLSYNVRLQDNHLVKRHLDQIRSRASITVWELEFARNKSDTENEINIGAFATANNEDDIDTNLSNSSKPQQSPSSSYQPITDAESMPAQPTPRRSKRIRKVPQVYSPSRR